MVLEGRVMAEDISVGLDGSEAEAELNRKKWSGKRIVMVAAPVLLLLIGGGTAVTMFFGGEKEVAAPVDPAALAANSANAPIVYVDLPDLLVNLKSTDRNSSYLKLSISLEVSGQAQADEIKKLMPRITDSFQVYLRELRIDDLSGSAGMFRLKEELLRRVNTTIEPFKINDILFKEMLVQ
ncbi:flagellar basal body-associated FliL family protein [Pedomonas mirosovicensis]|uniref:flagellar basal body-associated FliL family protein n=1 Tax=Pedomonas mirosovicensis TaxID=2908641 RepID=UPI002167D3CA|nr:flagellar basal body-associated FliL family protein [Pedomonas mirosovicensis]MCH8685104.1 flagellar basal body-associated FliL family protein [Pedomonas mirosovicensis]